MSKNCFNDKQVKILAKNKYVLKVSNVSITYSDVFKKIFIEKYLDGILPRVIFEECGFDVDMLGIKRIETAADRWKRKYKDNGFVGLKDTRKTNSGRPLKRELTSEEKLKKMEAKIKLLEAENELLKKLRMMERGGF